ncbi:MAG: hypothetical protein CO042_04130 [Parcubacteria group bacterium CG_4_9_14_0_2_um_filter_41_8]|nr:MAG: hypothetical protein AUJ34_01570 [Parcubacteria group bacterium CG1_02_41_12]PIP67067.1 MAG: hypothetical protein COW93_02145 [Parcubacteria group bacterium CG22_combo_CG10-13_8_21_14_all_41_9]PIQ80433.1 MAG: hypothetical protein COV79_00410 [Parcubacteria group bacterium CG11_big_fil_rev_8_21_14_0_20_41_14]PIR56988.1 MAG: hypothetical protein COU72_03255 [Parcubacteria group bacterium CG10_big_fil_rev_8_21_14_0_10_41_35]PIZ77824.1 MAG: hypothetical protein COY02_04405 [Parcubacteria gr
MEKIHFIQEAKRSVHSLMFHLVLQGVLMIALGILVVMHPQLIILFFAFTFIMIGLGSLWVAYKIRRVTKKFNVISELFG